MAWYWPSIHSSESAKAATVNAIGWSVVMALLLVVDGFGLFPSRHGGRISLPLLIVGTVFALVAWGIRKMSRIAATVGAFGWLSYCGFGIPRIIIAISRGADAFGLIWVFLDLLFLHFYVTAVRATISYHHFSGLQQQTEKTEAS